MKLENQKQDVLLKHFPYNKTIFDSQISEDAGEHYINVLLRDLFAEEDILGSSLNQRILTHAKIDGQSIETSYQRQQTQLEAITPASSLTDGLSHILDKQVPAGRNDETCDSNYPIFSLGGGYTMCYNSKYKNVSLSRYFSSTRAKIGKYEKYQIGLPVNILPMLILACLEYLRHLPDNATQGTYFLARNTTCKDITDVQDLIAPSSEANESSEQQTQNLQHDDDVDEENDYADASQSVKRAWTRAEFLKAQDESSPLAKKRAQGKRKVHASDLVTDSLA